MSLAENEPDPGLFLAVLLQTLRNNPNELLLPVLRRFERCLTLLGLTPSDGARICASPPAAQNIFDDM
ncbi:hypothetical protein [Rhodanobacter sp. MP7CTX1]|uniref:hypothetical protein n=1 Tax=Rhodanobacter sp. MP7CTX1 TaxID=2723084 RepID=UPI00161635D4|nr:hypothetical protein [Rhodanobacter sp. MP7CTX1]MBB6189316.1 recombinational DNA repair protein (RecF pathway) [Rhodanobacter sp. MP7CTX1]